MQNQLRTVNEGSESLQAELAYLREEMLKYYRSHISESDDLENTSNVDILGNILGTCGGSKTSETEVEKLKEQLETVKAKSKELLQRMKLQAESIRAELQERLDEALSQNDELHKELADLKQNLNEQPQNGGNSAHADEVQNRNTLDSAPTEAEAEIARLKEQLEGVKGKSRELLQKVKHQGEEARAAVQASLDEALARNQELEEQLASLRQGGKGGGEDGGVSERDDQSERALREAAEAEAARLKEQLEGVKSKSRELLQKVKHQGEEARAAVQASLDEALERNQELEGQLTSQQGANSLKDAQTGRVEELERELGEARDWLEAAEGELIGSVGQEQDLLRKAVVRASTFLYAMWVCRGGVML